MSVSVRPTNNGTLRISLATCSVTGSRPVAFRQAA
jgi:hypothetical protein